MKCNCERLGPAFLQCWASQVNVAGGQKRLISLALFQMFCIAWIKVTEKSTEGERKKWKWVIAQKSRQGEVWFLQRDAVVATTGLCCLSLLLLLLLSAAAAADRLRLLSLAPAHFNSSSHKNLLFAPPASSNLLPPSIFYSPILSHSPPGSISKIICHALFLWCAPPDHSPKKRRSTFDPLPTCSCFHVFGPLPPSAAVLLHLHTQWQWWHVSPTLLCALTPLSPNDAS